MEFNKIADWCKWLEKNFSPDIMIPTLPVIIRLDGVNFSKWTNKLKKPFDADLTKLMVETTKFLVNFLIILTSSFFNKFTISIYLTKHKQEPRSCRLI